MGSVIFGCSSRIAADCMNDNEGESDTANVSKVSNICITLLPKLQKLGDSVMEVQDQLRDGDFKLIMEATKGIFDACGAEKSRIENVIKQQKEVQGRLTYLVVENLVGIILRDEPWNELTISELKRLIIERSNGTVVPTGVGDDVLKSMMKKHIQQVLQVKEERKRRKRKRAHVQDEQKEEYLFPIFRR